MDKAIKQRLLGGLVLVAGAALFLPILLDGEGAPLTVPPMPAAPAAPTVAQVAPGLDAEVAQAEASVQAAQAGSTYEDVPASTEEDVAPDAAALVPEVAAQPATASVSAPAPDAAVKPAADKAAADKLAADKAAADKLAAQKAAALKLEKEKADKARQAAEAKAAAEKTAAAKVASEKAAAEKLAAEKAAAEKAATKKTTEVKAAPLPDAWVVQVASLSSKDKADALVSKLRQKNYRATAHQQGAVWKVTVGPELRRDVADSIKARLAADAELKLSGFVLPYKP